MELKFVKREIIKSSSPASPHLKSAKLSLLDQFASSLYVPVILFYSPDDDGESKATCSSRRLQTSLSETLTDFYPIIGRIKDHLSYQWDGDSGIHFVEVHIKCPLKHFLDNPSNLTMLKKLLPSDIDSIHTEAATQRMFSVQANFFECGGMALGACISHKFGDAATLSTFIQSWASKSLGSTWEQPVFNGPAIFPPLVDFPLRVPPPEAMRKTPCIMRRYVFTAPKVAKLKAKASSTSVERPTRVEVVSALLWKCAAKAARSNHGFLSRPSVMSHVVNLRTRMVPPLPENSVGNFTGSSEARTEGVNKMEDLKELVRLLREARERADSSAWALCGDGAAKAVSEAAKKLGELLKGGGVDFYKCSSWCRLPWYEADFGWGRPKWVSLTSVEFKNTMVFMDSRDGQGIEAWVTLSEEDMTVFERDQELLEFACSNPRIMEP